MAVGLAVLLPGGEPPKPPEHLPWQIQVLPDGSSRVFGIHLGKTTLGEMERQWQEEAEISLFATDAGERTVEGFFDSVTLDGLKAKVVAVLDFDPAALEGIFDRGARIASLAQGQRKVSLSGEDLELARRTPVVAITYLPYIDLDEALVEGRFGKPERRIAEPGGKVVHWLYPDKGLDIVMSQEAKEVLQYVPPAQFARRLLAPLQRFEASSGQ